MPTSGTGPSTNNSRSGRGLASAAGFTLIEMLVVVTIIGIFIGVATLSTDLVNFDRKMEQESKRLESLLQLASEDALLQSQDYGLRFFARGYEFFVFDHATQVWRPMEGDRVFAVRELERMVLELRVDDRDVRLDAEREIPMQSETEGADAEADDEDEPLYPTPQVVIFSSGEFTAFELTILDEADPFAPGVVLDVAFDGKTGDEGEDENENLRDAL
jgi:general secretion pathway protein H